MMIHFRNVGKHYGNKIALSINELCIWDGESIGLVGNNGAGKTTLLSLMLDLIKATSGQVFSKDLAVHKSDHWKSYTGSFLDEGFLIPYLTPIEFLEFAADLHGYNKVQVAQFLQEAKDFFNDAYWNVGYIRTLSAGNKAKVGILASLIIQPELIILDEPFAFLDPSSQAWLVRKLKALNAAGTTVIISSHDLHHVAGLSKRILLLENGKIIKDISQSDDTLSELNAYFNLNN